MLSEWSRFILNLTKPERKVFLLEDIISNIDIMYIVACNAATYFVIKMIDGGLKAGHKLKTWPKRIVATLVAIGLGFLMYYRFEHPMEPLFYGAFIQFITWDYLFKPLTKNLHSLLFPGGGIPDGPKDMDP